MNEVAPKKEREKELNPPGPGAYSDMRELHYSSIPGSKMGKDNRNSFFLKTTVSGNPEPGLYEKAGFAKVNY